MPVATTTDPVVEVKDAPIDAWRRDLLTLAFRAASKFPIDPHIKNRSRAQEQVVVACFELDQPTLAVALARDIADWRRSSAYADYAWYCGQRGDRTRAERYLKLVDQMLADEAKNPVAQEWRRDLVMMKVARAWGSLGELKKADAAMAGIEPTSTAAVDPTWARTAAERVTGMTLAQANTEVATIDREFLAMTLGQQSTALETLAKLHDHFYQDSGLRQRTEERLTKLFNKLPPKLRLDAIAEMVHSAVAHADNQGALDLVKAMQGIIEGFQWRAEDRVPELARLCELRFQAGDKDRARSELDAALVDYQQHRDDIVDIYRAETLRPVALAYEVMGDKQKGDDLLASVLEEGMENPNSRPRCDDFVDTCVSMAKRSVQPTASMLTRMREICEALGDPW